MRPSPAGSWTKLERKLLRPWGGHATLLVGGAPPYQTNTRARGQFSQPGQDDINQIMTAVHTPLLGTLCRKDILGETGVNTAVHTPLLRTLYPKDILEETGLHTESRAGFSEYGGGCDTIFTRGGIQTWRKCNKITGARNVLYP